MRAILIQAALCCAITAPATTQQPAPEAVETAAGLRVVFIGDGETDRTSAYARFLRERFDKVTVLDRARVDVAQLQDQADVVLLDWAQKDGVMKWFQDKVPCTEDQSPLGPRASWRTAAVLIGSAGLNMACVWEVKGGSG